jgi:hypothetical protein
MRIIFNAVVMLAELAAIAGVAWIGLHEPLIFAGATFVISLALGIALEIARLKNEMPFYFDRPADTKSGSQPGQLQLFTTLVGSSEAFVKALLAGVAALLTFLGTDTDRLTYVAVAFGICLFLGVQGVRFLTHRLQARPLRWGYFRLAAPLGLLFSAGLAFLPSPGITELAKRAAFDLPTNPSLAQASEFLFLLKQSFDDIVERMLNIVFSPDVATAISAFVSVNMLSGFVLALYAVLIAEAVRWMEQRS